MIKDGVDLCILRFSHVESKSEPQPSHLTFSDAPEGPNSPRKTVDRTGGKTFFLRMRNRQHLNRFFNPEAVNRSYHGSVVANLRQLCATFGLRRLTLHTAVFYFDAVMSKYGLQEENLNFVAVVCLSLAAKLLEKREKLISMEAIVTVLKRKFSLANVIDCENYVFQILNGQLRVFTPFHFLALFFHEELISSRLSDCSFSEMASFQPKSLNKSCFDVHQPSFFSDERQPPDTSMLRHRNSVKCSPICHYGSLQQRGSMLFHEHPFVAQRPQALLKANSLNDQVLEKFREKCFRTLEKALEEYSLCQFSSEVIAASVILATKKACKEFAQFSLSEEIDIDVIVVEECAAFILKEVAEEEKSVFRKAEDKKRKRGPK